MDLDKLILQKQNEAMHQNTLDIDWMNWDVSMEVILGEIERYESLPEGIKEELKILSVMLTADVGGVFTMEFEEDGSLYMSTTAKENDFFYDEIGSYLKIKQMRQEYEELFSSLEEYYRAFFAGKEE